MTQARFHAKNLQNNGRQDIAQRTKFLKVLRQTATQYGNPESHFLLIIMIVLKDVISLFGIFCVYMRVNCMCDSKYVTDAQVYALATHRRMDM